jgi:tRNA(Glu) U13 pseudouridine synthase TruD
VAILEALRHRRKLRRGALRGNRFLIRVRDALEIVFEPPAGA